MGIDDIGYIQAYKESFVEVLDSMTGIKGTISGPDAQEISFTLTGMAVIIGITGKYPGRIILWMNAETVSKLANAVNAGNDELVADEEYMMDIVAEFCNITAGHATTKVNNANDELNLMITPPGIFSGVDMGIISPKIKSELLISNTSIGKVFISIGFERGAD